MKVHSYSFIQQPLMFGCASGCGQIGLQKITFIHNLVEFDMEISMCQLSFCFEFEKISYLSEKCAKFFFNKVPDNL